MYLYLIEVKIRNEKKKTQFFRLKPQITSKQIAI